MSDFAPNEVRIHIKNGLPYVIPRIHLDDTMRLLERDIERIEYHKAVPEKPKEVIKVIPAKSKASLLGELLNDNKINAGELIEWIEKSKSIEDIAIVMKGEARKTVKAAEKQRINELL